MYPHCSVRYFCSLFGKSRQAWYEQVNRRGEEHLSDTIVLKLVKEIRENLPRAGVPKLHFMLKEKLFAHGIKMGRDALYQLLGEHGYLIRYRRRKPYTTDSNHPSHTGILLPEHYYRCLFKKNCWLQTSSHASQRWSY